MAVQFTTGGPTHISDYMATEQDYQQLFDLLSASPEIAARNVYVNRFGEWTPHDAQDLARRIRDGLIWIEYCGWPMYHTQGVAPKDPYRFTRFLTAAVGRKLTALPYTDKGVIFDPKSIEWRCLPRYLPSCVNGRITEYQYDRGLVSDVAVTTYPEFNVDLTLPITKKVFYTLPDVPGTFTVYVYSHLAVKVGSGWYFWACRQKPWGWFGSADGIAPEPYANFIAKTLGATIPPPSDGGPPPPPPPGYDQPPISDAEACRAAGGTWTGSECVFPDGGGGIAIDYKQILLIAGIMAAAGIGGYLLTRGGRE